MTVQAQGLLMAVSGMNAGKSFANNAKISQQVNFQDVMAQSSMAKGDASDSIPQSGNDATDKVQNQSIATTTGTSDRPIKEVISNDKDNVTSKDISDQEQKAMDYLEEQFGLTEEQLTDIMQQLGISPADLLTLLQPEKMQLTPGVNQEALQSLVLEVHGIEDASVLLTNSDLSEELQKVMAGLEDILAGNIPDETASVTSTDTQAQTLTNLMDADEQLPTMEKGFAKVLTGIQSENEPQAEQVVKDDQVEVVFQKDELTAQTSENTENADLNGSNKKSSGNESLQKTELPTSTETKGELTANEMFTQKFTQAFEQLGKTTEVAQDMGKVVMQVVEQIKVRVMPETTKMELTLNPETLGKVNVSVSSQNGATTATITVQNQTAKEALETQITLLKETFSEKGLKVESVEVNVSEFGFQEENQSESQEQAGNSKRKRFPAANDLGFEEESEEDTTINADSVINYTA